MCIIMSPIKQDIVKKPYPNTVLSDKKCKRCGKHLKVNLVVKRPDAELCYRCWSRARRISHA